MQRRQRCSGETEDQSSGQNPRISIGKDQFIQETNDQLPYPTKHHLEIPLLLQVSHGQQS